MQFPESWLRAWANPDISSQELAERLTMAGLEVEEAHPYAPAFSGIVVAKILSAKPHPDADRLQVCTVADGTGEELQIVCGAPNARAGIVVPLARVGARLPDGMHIKKAKMRGVESFGMLCSARELGISQDHAGLLELDGGLELGADLRVALDLDDMIFTIKLTPNRADCLSIQGVAHELAALTGCQLNQPNPVKISETITDTVPVKVLDTDLCGRFAGRVVRGVNAQAPTPEWLKSRLERAGQRSISALVDISNFIMLEYGRPTHVFDLDKLSGGLTVRWAREGETLQLLSGQEISLQPDVGVIESNAGLESLAGIMGGNRTAVSLDTSNVFLEAAFWWPEAIMGRARRYKFSSEASHRFERGVDYSNIPEHLDRMTALILEVCGGQAGPMDDQIINLPRRSPVRMRLQRCCKVLGVQLDAMQVADIFTRLGFDFIQEGADFVVTPAAARFDLSIEEDLIEEVARIYGFENIPDVPPKALANIIAMPETEHGPHGLRQAMAAMDYQEVINYSFVDAVWEQNYCANSEPIRLLNPIASHLAVMRTSLIGGLLDNIAYNARRNQSRVRVFELGRVFKRDASVIDGDLSVAGIDQAMMLAAAAWGYALPEQWGVKSKNVDFFDVKNDLQCLLGARAAQLRCQAAEHPALHPGRSARLLLDGADIGWLGELHPRWVQALDLVHAPVVFEVQAQAVAKRLLPKPQPLSRQPVVVRDLAIWVGNEHTWQAILDSLRTKITIDPGLSVVKDIKLFDVWRDEAVPDQRSMAMRFWFQGLETSLDDAGIESCVQSLFEALQQEHGARMRK